LSAARSTVIRDLAEEIYHADLDPGELLSLLSFLSWFKSLFGSGYAGLGDDKQEKARLLWCWITEKGRAF